jgi:hypothetical protein
MKNGSKVKIQKSGSKITHPKNARMQVDEKLGSQTLPISQQLF